MVRIAAPHRPSSAAPRLNQDFEGHGVVAPAPCDRGFRRDNLRPASAVGERSRAAAEAAAESGEGRKGKKGAPALKIYCHVREKVIPVRAGAGSQKVFWLGATAVHRYLSQPQSYMSAFSLELTPKYQLS